MARQLFGTDGIRGVAGQYPLDARTVYVFGRALGEWAKSHSETPRVLIGMDTRESGPALAAQVTAGLAHEDVEFEVAGVLTTPGVAWLTRNGSYAAGLMISASHNPFQDNGLKLFAHSGYKVPDAEELELEKRIFALAEESAGVAGDLQVHSGAGAGYTDFLRHSFTQSLAKLKIVVDGGNGSASAFAPALLRSLGAEVVELHCSPTVATSISTAGRSTPNISRTPSSPTMPISPWPSMVMPIAPCLPAAPAAGSMATTSYSSAAATHTTATPSPPIPSSRRSCPTSASNWPSRPAASSSLVPPSAISTFSKR